MAFYNDKMVQNSNLMMAWRAGHNIHVEEDARLLEICEEIESHLRRHRHPCSRLSLRTASELLAGASRLHLDGVDRLMHDTFKLAYGAKSAPPAYSPMSRTDNIYSGSGYEVSSSSSEAAISDAMSSDDDGEESSVSTHDEIYDGSVPSTPQKKNQAVQTENIQEENQEDLDPNLPFGQFLIFNSPASRYPSMFMISSLNRKVKNMMSLISDKK